MCGCLSRLNYIGPEGGYCGECFLSNIPIQVLRVHAQCLSPCCTLQYSLSLCGRLQRLYNDPAVTADNLRIICSGQLRTDAITVENAGFDDSDGGLFLYSSSAPIWGRRLLAASFVIDILISRGGACRLRAVVYLVMKGGSSPSTSSGRVVNIRGSCSLEQ